MPTYGWVNFGAYTFHKQTSMEKNKWNLKSFKSSKVDLTKIRYNNIQMKYTIYSKNFFLERNFLNHIYNLFDYPLPVFQVKSTNENKPNYSSKFTLRYTHPTKFNRLQQHPKKTTTNGLTSKRKYSPRRTIRSRRYRIIKSKHKLFQKKEPLSRPFLLQ